MILRQVEARVFLHWLIHAKQTLRQPLGFGLHLYKPRDYEDMLCILAEGGLSGYAIKKDGELINVFSRPKGVGDQLVVDAISRGALHLDCFDGYLTSFYSRHGFTETGRETWNPEFSPTGWNIERFGTPDVVYMRRVL